MLQRAEQYKADPDNCGIIAQRIAAGEYSLKQKHQKYLQHVEGTPQYERATKDRNRPQSYLTISEQVAQGIIYRYAGTGKAKRLYDGNLVGVEFITVPFVIGKHFAGDRWRDTSRVQIIYSAKGTHIVPVIEKGNI